MDQRREGGRGSEESQNKNHEICERNGEKCFKHENCTQTPHTHSHTHLMRPIISFFADFIAASSSEDERERKEE